MESTLTTVYLGDNGRVALVDPGWDTPENRERLETWLVLRGRCLEDISLVAASHLHADHVGLGPWLHELTGVPVTMHETDVKSLLCPPPPVADGALFDRWGVPADHRGALGQHTRNSFPFVEPATVHGVAEGDMLDAAGTALRVVHTPGHTSGSLCFVDMRNEVLMTGDHVLPIVRPGLGMGDDDPHDPIGDYLSSLDVLRPYRAYEVLPGHEFRFHGLAERLDELAAHHLRRSAQIGQIVGDMSEPTVWEVAERVDWTGGWEAVTAHLRRSALAQTEFHIRFLGLGGIR